MKNDNNVKNKIIETARSLFAKYGYKKTSMQDIADIIHKTKGVLYYYFKNKEEIFYAIVENDTRELKKIIYEAVKNEDTPENKLKAYVLTRQKGYQRLSVLYQALHTDIFSDSTLIAHIRGYHEKEEIAIIKMMLRQGVKKDIFKTDIDNAAKAIFVTLKGFELIWDINRNDESYMADINILLDILFNGIRKR